MFGATSTPSAVNSGEGSNCPDDQKSQQKWILKTATLFQQFTADASDGTYDRNPEPGYPNLNLFRRVLEACRAFDESLPKTIDANKCFENTSYTVGGYNITTNILLSLLYKHTHNWPELAKKFTENLLRLLRCYIQELFQLLCRDEMQHLRNTLEHDMLERCETALSHIAECVKIERHAMTTKRSDLANTLDEMRSRPMKADTDCKDSEGQSYMTSVCNLNNSRKNAQVVADPHRDLMDCYEATRKRVFDTIIKNVDYGLLTGKHNPLTIRTPMYISVLSEEEKAEVPKQLSHLMNGQAFKFPSYTRPVDLRNNRLSKRRRMSKQQTVKAEYRPSIHRRVGTTEL